MKYLNKFIVSLANKEILNQKIVSEYLKTYLKTYLKNQRIIEFDTNGLYNNLTNIYREYKEYPIQADVLSNIIELIKKFYEEKNYNFLYYILEHLIVPIVKTLNEDYQILIKDIIENLILEIKHKEDSLQFNEFYFYYIVLISDIVTEDENINKEIIEDTVKKISNQDKSIKSHPDPIERNLNIITDLYRRNRLKKEEIEEYMDSFNDYSEYFDLIFNSRNLNLTNIELLQHLKEEEIVSLMDVYCKIKVQTSAKNLYRVPHYFCA